MSTTRDQSDPRYQIKTEPDGEGFSRYSAFFDGRCICSQALDYEECERAIEAHRKKSPTDKISESQTPRTDAKAHNAPSKFGVFCEVVVDVNFARRLETELTAALAEVENLKSDWDADAQSHDACLREAHQENDRLKAAVAPLLTYLDEVGGATTGNIITALQNLKAAMQDQ